MARVHELWRTGAIVPVVSQETFDEFLAVLGYPKFALTDDEVRAIVEEQCLPFFDVAEVEEPVSGVCEDPDDDKFLSCAIAGLAGWLVTGDRALLALGKYREVRIISVRELLQLVA